MNIDLRGFDYDLESLRRRRQWQLETLHARLGKMQRSIEEAREALDELRHQLTLETQEAAHSLRRRLDPRHYGRCVQWLAQLQAQIHAGETRLSELRTQRLQLSAQCVAMQFKLDVIEAHRDECVADYSRLEAGRLSTEADRDWLARGPSRRSSHQPGTMPKEIQP